ncbi:MAG: AraC family transcriptional regulator [Planctomycetota bacterium]|nr:AraC family transcriptional regulator [Planctomycetota bacterium]
MARKRRRGPVPAGRFFMEPWTPTSEPLLWLAGCGHEIRASRSDYYFDSRQRSDVPHVVLQWTLSGAGWYERAGRAVLLTRGMAFVDVIPGPFRYGYPPGGREPYELAFISMRGPAARRWQRRLTANFGHVLALGPGHPVEAQMRALIGLRAQESLGDRYQISARLYQIVMSLLSALSQSRAATSPLVAQALACIERRARDAAFNVAELARELGCSREHLARSFQAGLRVTPLAYLTEHRLRLVMRELRDGHEKLGRVAERCGFSGANYLCRVFRGRHGISPARARARPWMLG